MARLLGVLAALQLSFEPQAVRWVHQIPEGFSGFVTIVFSAPNGEKTFRVDAQARTFEGDRLFEIPESGVLFAAEPIDRYRRDEYILVSRTGTRQRLPVLPLSRADEVDDLLKSWRTPAVTVSMELGGRIGPPDCRLPFVRYFVGTLVETQRQLERQHGPISDAASLDLIRAQIACPK
ncbi:MAG: hypothetical protein U0Q11_16100 [Vicinamibacterales bacterium]